MTDINISQTYILNLPHLSYNEYPTLIEFTESNNIFLDCDTVRQWAAVITQARFDTRCNMSGFFPTTVLPSINVESTNIDIGLTTSFPESNSKYEDTSSEGTSIIILTKLTSALFSSNTVDYFNMTTIRNENNLRQFPNWAIAMVLTILICVVVAPLLFLIHKLLLRKHKSKRVVDRQTLFNFEDNLIFERTDSSL